MQWQSGVAVLEAECQEMGERGFCLLDEGPEELPRRNAKAVVPVVIPADLHEPDEAALLAVRDGESASKLRAVELLLVLLAGNLPPVLPVRRRLDEPRLQMGFIRAIMKCVDDPGKNKTTTSTAAWPEQVYSKKKMAQGVFKRPLFRQKHT
jgi:hypothetical protein